MVRDLLGVVALQHLTLRGRRGRSLPVARSHCRRSASLPRFVMRVPLRGRHCHRRLLPPSHWEILHAAHGPNSASFRIRRRSMMLRQGSLPVPWSLSWGGTRPSVSPLQVGMLLEEFFSVQPGDYEVFCFEPEDFLVEFTMAAAADRILHAHYPTEALFQLIWKRWRRQATTSLESLRFRILIEFRGIPAHARSISTARVLLDTSCSDLVEAPPELVGNDGKKFFVCAWCIHPDLVPQEKKLFIQEPPEPYVESGLFLRPHEIIHSKHDGLWYRVHIRIVEIQDWNLSSDSSDDGTPPDNFDSDEDEYPGFEQRSRYKPWPKRTRFDDAAGSGGGPQLGPGWGLPFLGHPLSQLFIWSRRILTGLLFGNNWLTPLSH
ncbi:hypothetical protein PVAP13_9KG437200 [Panicum virgatum]|uniref:Uncharacterized protein n=1 Tax=Panicum virgatum TaxID=38727 RepID=A0A8T0NRJ3_PANVG|nr:hypothetical protein PVAP13_9KG437200 [Panicum virgatum]